MIFFLMIVFWLAVIWNAYFYIAYRPRSLAGKTVLITGGAAGIGRLMAKSMAAQGAHLVLWDVDREGLRLTGEEILASGGNVRTLVVDISDREKVYRAAKEAGDVDVLVNNAGIVSGKSFLDTPDEMMEKVVDVNTLAHFWTIKAFLPGMVKRNSGHIVTIASAAGMVGTAGLVDYSASKFGAVGTAGALYMEIRKKKWNIQTTLICPFYIRSRLFDGAKSAHSWLLPLLDEGWTAARIVTAIRRGEEHVVMPGMLYFIPVAQLLPAPWAAKVFEILGISNSMDSFKGKTASKTQ